MSTSQSAAVAVLRAIILATLVGAAGLGLLALAYDRGGVEQTITDLTGDPVRVNIVWWAISGFVGCLAALSGLVAGGAVLLDQTVRGPGAALVVVGLPLLVWLAAGVLLVDRADWLGSRATLPLAAGAGIGLAAAAIYLVHRGGEADPYATFASATTRSQRRSWGSR